MLPASFYDYGISSKFHTIPMNPQRLRDAAVNPQGVAGVRGAPKLAGIGEELPTFGYALAALAGAGVGGALIGWVASDHVEGAKKGAGFAAGLVGVSDGFATFKDNKALGTTLMLAGLGGIWWSLRGKMKSR